MIYLYFYRDKISHKHKILILNKQSITYKDYTILILALFALIYLHTSFYQSHVLISIKTLRNTLYIYIYIYIMVSIIIIVQLNKEEEESRQPTQKEKRDLKT
jgi:magnesium-transporting ATPase (P-type)